MKRPEGQDPHERTLPAYHYLVNLCRRYYSPTENKLQEFSIFNRNDVRIRPPVVEPNDCHEYAVESLKRDVWIPHSAIRIPGWIKTVKGVLMHFHPAPIQDITGTSSQHQVATLSHVTFIIAQNGMLKMSWKQDDREYSLIAIGSKTSCTHPMNSGTRAAAALGQAGIWHVQGRNMERGWPDRDAGGQQRPSVGEFPLEVQVRQPEESLPRYGSDCGVPKTRRITRFRIRQSPSMIRLRKKRRLLLQSLLRKMANASAKASHRLDTTRCLY